MSFKETAATMLGRNIPVIPIPPREKGTKLKNWPKLATTDIVQIERWNSENPEYNCGAVATAEGVWILDCDIPDLAQQIEREAGHSLPATFVVQSSKGSHYYFKQTAASRAMRNRKVEHLFDAQVQNKYVVAPGSVHPSGILYTITDDSPIVEAPGWVIDWVLDRTQKRIQSNTSNDPRKGGEILEGGRDNFLFEEACKLRKTGMAADDAVAALMAINESRCKPPMLRSVVGQKIESVYKSFCPSLVIDKDTLGLTDVGNALRFARDHSKSIRYSHTESKWWVYDGMRWVLDDTGEIFRLAKNSIKKILKEAIGVETDEQRRALVTHEQRSESQQRIRSMITLAQSEASPAYMAQRSHKVHSRRDDPPTEWRCRRQSKLRPRESRPGETGNQGRRSAVQAAPVRGAQTEPTRSGRICSKIPQ